MSLFTFRAEFNKWIDLALGYRTLLSLWHCLFQISNFHRLFLSTESLVVYACVCVCMCLYRALRLSFLGVRKVTKIYCIDSTLRLGFSLRRQFECFFFF